MTAPTSDDLVWDAHLDALEEWVRGCRAALTTGGPDGETQPPPVPTGEPGVPLPRSQALRAQVVVAAMDAVAAEAAGRRAADDRAARYRRD